MILIKDLAVKIGVHKTTALRAIKKMEDIEIHSVKVPGTPSLVSAIDEDDIEKVREHFGLNTRLTK